MREPRSAGKRVGLRLVIPPRVARDIAADGSLPYGFVHDFLALGASAVPALRTGQKEATERPASIWNRKLWNPFETERQMAHRKRPGRTHAMFTRLIRLRAIAFVLVALPSSLLLLPASAKAETASSVVTTAQDVSDSNENLTSS